MPISAHWATKSAGGGSGVVGAGVKMRGAGSGRGASDGFGAIGARAGAAGLLPRGAWPDCEGLACWAGRGPPGPNAGRGPGAPVGLLPGLPVGRPDGRPPGPPLGLPEGLPPRWGPRRELLSPLRPFGGGMKRHSSGAKPRRRCGYKTIGRVRGSVQQPELNATTKASKSSKVKNPSALKSALGPPASKVSTNASKSSKVTKPSELKSAAQIESWAASE